MAITIHHGDLPEDFICGESVAIDTEAMGLKNYRDRLCVVQLSTGDGNAHLVQFTKDEYAAPHLKAILADEKILKIFHFARFDVAIIQHYLDVSCAPLYCTKIASYLARTYTDRHGLKELCKEILGVDLSKQQQSSDWGAQTLTPEQEAYAANDVLYLHQLRERLDEMLAREGRMQYAQSCFDFIPVRAALDLEGWDNFDIFSH